MAMDFIGASVVGASFPILSTHVLLHISRLGQYRAWATTQLDSDTVSSSFISEDWYSILRFIIHHSHLSSAVHL